MRQFYGDWGHGHIMTFAHKGGGTTVTCRCGLDIRVPKGKEGVVALRHRRAVKEGVWTRQELGRPLEE